MIIVENQEIGIEMPLVKMNQSINKQQCVSICATCILSCKNCVNKTPESVKPEPGWNKSNHCPRCNHK